MFPFVNLYIWTIRCACHKSDTVFSFCISFAHFCIMLSATRICLECPVIIRNWVVSCLSCCAYQVAIVVVTAQHHYYWLAAWLQLFDALRKTGNWQDLGVQLVWQWPDSFVRQLRGIFWVTFGNRIIKFWCNLISRFLNIVSALSAYTHNYLICFFLRGITLFAAVGKFFSFFLA